MNSNYILFKKKKVYNSTIHSIKISYLIIFVQIIKIMKLLL